MVGKTREPGEKPPQACTEQTNRVDITKHKCRNIGLPDGMGVPNRQAAQGDGSTGTTLSGHCAIASQTLILWRHAPVPPISETPRNYPSLAFSEAPGTTIKALTDHTVCGESTHSISWLQVHAKSSTTTSILHFFIKVFYAITACMTQGFTSRKY